MKLGMVGVAGVVLAAVTSIGCGPGLGHHGKWAKAAGEQVSTTTLTSDDSLLPPHSRMSAAQWEDPSDRQQGDPGMQTWGAPPKPEDRYGF